MEQEYIYKMKSPVGELLLSSDGSALTGLWIEGQKYFAGTLDGQHLDRRLPVFEKAEEWLSVYFEGREPAFSIPLAPKGSDFRQKVWDTLLSIPYGEVTTYGEVAGQIARRNGIEKMSAQAVGQAVGHNPISIIIPCHRVVGTSGSLTGYGGGIGIKVRLLELEKVKMDGLWIPKKGTAI